MVASVTVQGRWLNADGDPASGRVRIFPSQSNAHPPDDRLLAKATVEERLDDTGAMSTVLAATDDDGWTAPGWTYTISVLVDGTTDSWSFEVPAALDGQVVALSDLAPVAPVEAVATYATLAQLLEHTENHPSGDGAVEVTGSFRW